MQCFENIKREFKFCFLALLLSLLVSMHAYGSEPIPPPNATLKKNIEKLIQEYADSNQFQGTVLVKVQNKDIWTFSHGKADELSGIPNGRNVSYRIGSITKQFTAAAILLLQGRYRRTTIVAAYTYQRNH